MSKQGTLSAYPTQWISTDSCGLNGGRRRMAQTRMASGFACLERRGRDLNPRRTQEPERVFENAHKTLFAGILAVVRQFVRHDSAFFDVKTDNGARVRGLWRIRSR